MSDLNVNPPVDITCPKCGHKFKKTIRELKADTRFTCPKCGQDFDSSDFKTAI